jgi:hypothetical protein
LSVTVGVNHVKISTVSVVVLDIFSGQFTKTGALVSGTHGFMTVTMKEHVVVLPKASVALYATVVSPIGNTAPELCVLITKGVPQLSVAVGGVHVTMTDVSDIVLEIFAGQFAKTGLVLSLSQRFMTVTVNEHVAVLFSESFAVYVTVVMPTLNFVPEVSVLVTEGVLQLSVAVGAVHVAMTPDVSEIVLEILAGQADKTGFIVSIAHGLMTVTVNEQVDLLFLASVAVKVTVVMPSLNLVPDVSLLTIENALQSSVTVGVNHETTTTVSVIVLKILSGQFTKTGATVSGTHGFMTVTVNEHVALLFFASVAV